MAQQYPYWQQNGLPGQGNSRPPAPGVSAPFLPPSGGNQSLPGVDPAQMAMIQQMLQNPNAMDSYLKAAMSQLEGGAQPGVPGTGGEMPEFTNPFMPGSPADMALGAGVGIGVSAGLEALHNKGHIVNLARRIDNLPGVGKLNGFLESQLSKMRGQWADEIFLRNVTSSNVDEAVRVMQRRHIDNVVRAFKDQVPDVARLAQEETFEGFMRKATERISELDGLIKSKSGDVKAHKALRKTLTGLRNRISGLDGHYMPLFKDQAYLAQRLHAEKIGPIGRMVASIGNYTRRIFGGNVMTESMAGMRNPAKRAAEQAAKEGGGLLGKVFGPAMAGAFIFGQAISKAKKAPEGEKVKTFFHDFLGFGIANFVGWEIGRKVLNGFNVFGKLLGKKAILHPLKFLRFIPVIGPFLGGITLAGMATEMVAMFLFGSVAQKVGEWISHRIFGKPSQAALDAAEGKKPKPPTPSNANGQPLNRKDFSQFTRNPAGPVPASAHAASQFSLSPAEIAQSHAAARQQELSSQIINQPWNAHGFDPSTGH